MDSRSRKRKAFQILLRSAMSIAGTALLFDNRVDAQCCDPVSSYRLQTETVLEHNVSLGKEVFPGVLCLHILKGKDSAVAFIDATNGAELRRIPGYSLAPRPFSLYVETVPPPGTPGARLLLSAGKLYELPSLQAEPRLLLPKAPGA